MQLRQVTYGSDDYQATLALRNRVMRIPLGLNIYTEDFSFEKNALIIGAFEAEQLTGVGVMTHTEDVYKVEYLCVDTSLQSTGIGGRLLDALEQAARSQGGTKMCMDARCSAQAFYTRHGYAPCGEVFLLDYAPVPHIVMEKVL